MTHKGGGGWSSRPLDKWGGGGSLQKKFFQAFGPQFGKKNKRRAPLDPPLEYNFADVSLYPPWQVHPMQGDPDSGIWEIFACGIQNPMLWNPEYISRNLESH